MAIDPRPTTGQATDGVLETRDGRHFLRFERYLEDSVERVWAALTERAELSGWLAQADIDLAVGGRVVLRWQNSDSILHATITRLDPPRLLEYNSDIRGLLRWELRPDAGGCWLTFTSTIPAPNEQVCRSLAGWQIHLDHLAAALHGRAVSWPAWEADYMGRWTAYHDRYAERYM